MSVICKHCLGIKVVKNGFTINDKQRYKCKECSKVFREGDDRSKYDFNQKVKVLKMYLEGVGIRSISRLEGVSAPVIIDWIRGVSKIVQQKLLETKVPDDAKEIQILELDELFSYCQKKLTKSMYGLVLIGSEIRLLTLK